MGQSLVVNKRLKLVSKKKHDAGVFGYETRQDFQIQHKLITTKPKKSKVSHKKSKTWYVEMYTRIA